MPTDVHIEREEDGSVTVWMSEHDPLQRMKGMHGVRLSPDSACITLRVRLFNRTPLTRTFLWWANVAARVHDRYKSFFPTDVHYVADHAIRAMTAFPYADNPYYGIDYRTREGCNDLRWYKNIPVPTSYMVCETNFDFFGGYDFEVDGGFVHVANRHIAPGKKQWTWGNSEFGRAWDRELTDQNGPYIELMAGVYTDNQPDFTYLAPYETKTFSQFWWPYQKIGSLQQANQVAAMHFEVDDKNCIHWGVAASKLMEGASIQLYEKDHLLFETQTDLAPDRPWIGPEQMFEGTLSDLTFSLKTHSGEPILSYRPIPSDASKRSRSQATEPPFPKEILSMDELYLTGEHLEQYRHATRYPEPYWEEMLLRDPDEHRAHVALGRKALERGLFDKAEKHFQKAIQRLTMRHPNPESGEAHYHLGLAYRFRDQYEDAYAAFYKATWNFAWRAASYYELGCLDMIRGDYQTALSHFSESLTTNTQNNKAIVGRVICLRKIGRIDEAKREIASLLKIDPLDHWAHMESAFLAHQIPESPAARNDAQTLLDLAFDYADMGALDEAVAILTHHEKTPSPSCPVPNPLGRSLMVRYVLAWLHDRKGERPLAHSYLESARRAAPEYCFPSRLHEQMVLEWALAQPLQDRNAAYGLGNFFYDRKRYEDAIETWETAREADPQFAGVHRNLGLAYWNIRGDREKARQAYAEAWACDQEDARILFEYDQLCKKLGDDSLSRLKRLEAHLEVVSQRDDLSVELADLYNATAQPGKALEILLHRRFHPWEGGEGKVLRVYREAHSLLGKEVLNIPDSLGEKPHPVQKEAEALPAKTPSIQNSKKAQGAPIAYFATSLPNLLVLEDDRNPRER